MPVRVGSRRKDRLPASDVRRRGGAPERRDHLLLKALGRGQSAGVR